MECIEGIPVRPLIENRGMRSFDSRWYRNEQAHDEVAVGLVRPAGYARESSLRGKQRDSGKIINHRINRRGNFVRVVDTWIENGKSREAGVLQTHCSPPFHAVASWPGRIRKRFRVRQVGPFNTIGDCNSGGSQKTGQSRHRHALFPEEYLGFRPKPNKISPIRRRRTGRIHVKVRENKHWKQSCGLLHTSCFRVVSSEREIRVVSPSARAMDNMNL